MAYLGLGKITPTSRADFIKKASSSGEIPSEDDVILGVRVDKGADDSCTTSAIGILFATDSCSTTYPPLPKTYFAKNIYTILPG